VYLLILINSHITITGQVKLKESTALNFKEQWVGLVDDMLDVHKATLILFVGLRNLTSKTQK
jgi:hypothetical protein